MARLALGRRIYMCARLTNCRYPVVAIAANAVDGRMIDGYDGHPKLRCMAQLACIGTIDM